ncbi:MAG: hypothetical protein B5M53_05255 [Candidatus Cloacimonas sp. 4484_209]|nr:MAG: hypothetical protein B5M53_05255 [Candidatus Cloacimonas sp. 4484_209]
MIEIDIPGVTNLNIKNVVFDVNGTLAVDGKIDSTTKKKLQDISHKVNVYILTADTYGTIFHEMKDTGINITKITPLDEAKQKEKFVKKLGEKKTIAVGNGANDALMLKTSALGICVIDREGAFVQSIQNADIVIFGKENVFELLENPKRIVATMRR